MFKTRIFSVGDIEERNLLEAWLNSLQQPGFGVRVVSQVCLPETDFRGVSILTTASTWKLSETPAIPVSATIDPIPEEPSISYSEEEDINRD